MCRRLSPSRHATIKTLCACAELRQRHPELWAGFAQAVRMRPSLSAYWDAVGAVDALPLAPPPPPPLPPLPPELSSVASLPLSVRGRAEDPIARGLSPACPYRSGPC